jgi:hypothetical protein
MLGKRPLGTHREELKGNRGLSLRRTPRASQAILGITLILAFSPGRITWAQRLWGFAHPWPVLDEQPFPRRHTPQPLLAAGIGPGPFHPARHPAAPPFVEKPLIYLRVCTSKMITPVPFRIPGTGIKACAMSCECDDGAFGIGLYDTKRLASFCSVAAETICPWQIKTISPSSPAGVPVPVQFTDPQIVSCRLLESRPWE